MKKQPAEHKAAAGRAVVDRAVVDMAAERMAVEEDSLHHIVGEDIAVEVDTQDTAVLDRAVLEEETKCKPYPSLFGADLSKGFKAGEFKRKLRKLKDGSHSH
jgi:hypothetical protein